MNKAFAKVFRDFLAAGRWLIPFLALAPQSFAAAPVEVPVFDMRGADPLAAKAKALELSRDGVAILYQGADGAPAKALQTVAGECADGGFQVKGVVLAQPQGGEGVVLYGAVGGPLGPLISVSSDLRAQTKSQIVSLKERLDRAGGGATAAFDPLDVVHCRYQAVVGSLVRKEKICTTARQDEEARKSSKDWTRRQQNRGANEAMPSGG